jgi:hypothetical protein
MIHGQQNLKRMSVLKNTKVYALVRVRNKASAIVVGYTFIFL